MRVPVLCLIFLGEVVPHNPPWEGRAPARPERNMEVFNPRAETPRRRGCGVGRLERVRRSTETSNKPQKISAPRGPLRPFGFASLRQPDACGAGASRLCGKQNAYLTGSLQKSRRPQSAQKSRTLLRLCFAKLLVLLVGGPDDFVAGASPFESCAFFGAFPRSTDWPSESQS